MLPSIEVQALGTDTGRPWSWILHAKKPVEEIHDNRGTDVLHPGRGAWAPTRIRDLLGWLRKSQSVIYSTRPISIEGIVKALAPC